MAQAFYTTNAARAAFYPAITLSGSAGWTNSAGSMIVNPGKFLASAVASLTQPLFNKGANIAQLKIAKAQQEEARLSFEQTLLNAGVEVNEALVQYQTAREKADYYNKQVASLQTAAKKHKPVDETWQHHLSGSIDRPTDVAQRATVTSGEPLYRNPRRNHFVSGIGWRPYVGRYV